MAVEVELPVLVSRTLHAIDAESFDVLACAFEVVPQEMQIDHGLPRYTVFIFIRPAWELVFIPASPRTFMVHDVDILLGAYSCLDNQVHPSRYDLIVECSIGTIRIEVAYTSPKLFLYKECSQGSFEYVSVYCAQTCLHNSI